VGSAAVTEVGHYLKTYARDPNNALIVSSEGSYVPVGTNTSLGSVPSTYPLRLIVHNPATGPATLFQRVFVGFDGASNAIVANQEAPLNRNLLGEARRISASHLPFSSANTGWTFSGPLPPGGAVTTSVTNRFDNRSSNPFLHTYHPDHDNLDVHFTTELAQGSESYTVVRDITLDVQPPADDFASRTAAAQTVVGEYAETIRLLGLARPGNTFDTRAFQVRGSFSLNRIADIPTVTRTP
jgi:hypothetical protein